MTPHQIDMVLTLAKLPEGIEFTVGDITKTYGYPHKDASRILSQEIMLHNFVSYSRPSFRGGKVRYRRHPDYAANRLKWAEKHKRLREAAEEQ